MIKTTVTVDGMACGMCEAHINDAVRANFKVKKVDSSHKKGITEIIAEQPIDEEKVKEVIKNAGYTATAVSSAEYVKNGLFGR